MNDHTTRAGDRKTLNYIGHPHTTHTPLWSRTHAFETRNMSRITDRDEKELMKSITPLHELGKGGKNLPQPYFSFFIAHVPDLQVTHLIRICSAAPRVRDQVHGTDSPGNNTRGSTFPPHQWETGRRALHSAWAAQLPIMLLAYPRLHDVSHLFILLAIVAAACELSLVLFSRIPGKEAIVTLSPPPMRPLCGEISLAS